MRRAGRPVLSPLGQQVLDQYEQQLRTAEDLTAATIRNYLSDLHHFAAWYLFTPSNSTLAVRFLQPVKARFIVLTVAFSEQMC